MGKTRSKGPRLEPKNTVTAGGLGPLYMGRWIVHLVASEPHINIFERFFVLPVYCFNTCSYVFTENVSGCNKTFKSLYYKCFSAIEQQIYCSHRKFRDIKD